MKHRMKFRLQRPVALFLVLPPKCLFAKMRSRRNKRQLVRGFLSRQSWKLCTSSSYDIHVTMDRYPKCGSVQRILQRMPIERLLAEELSTHSQ